MGSLGALWIGGVYRINMVHSWIFKGLLVLKLQRIQMTKVMGPYDWPRWLSGHCKSEHLQGKLSRSSQSNQSNHFIKFFKLWPGLTLANYGLILASTLCENYFALRVWCHPVLDPESSDVYGTHFQIFWLASAHILCTSFFLLRMISTLCSTAFVCVFVNKLVS